MKTIKTPYFQGDPVPLKFEARTRQGDIEPSSAIVSVFAGKTEVIHEAPAEIEGNEISYEVPKGSTEFAGDYRADFTVYIQPDRQLTHVIRFHIAQKDTFISKEADAELMPVDDLSNEYETSGAIAHATRLLRRSGELVTEAARIARDLAEQMTGRRI